MDNCPGLAPDKVEALSFGEGSVGEALGRQNTSLRRIKVADEKR